VTHTPHTHTPHTHHTHTYYPITNDMECLVIYDYKVNVAGTLTGPKGGTAALLIDDVQLLTH